MIPTTKICGVCKKRKKASMFSLRKKKGGKYVWLRLQCKKCENGLRRIAYAKDSTKYIERAKNYYTLNREKQKNRHSAWAKKNAKKVAIQRSEKYKANAEAIKLERKKYYARNREKQKEAVSNYVKENLLAVRKRQRKNHAKRKLSDPAYVLKRRLRFRVQAALKNKGVKCARTTELIGCTMEFLIGYLERQFKEGMTWDNAGIRGWHIDHKKPCSSFNMLDPEEQKKCFHYSNLQPLWWQENLRKSNKVA